MIYQIITVVVMILVSIGLFIWEEYGDCYSSWRMPVSVTLLVIAIMWGIMLPIIGIGNSQNVAVYNRQRAYIDNHVPDNAIEDAAMTQKKIELNDWLYGAQFAKQKFGNWSLYPDEILDLEPIQ